MHLVPCQHHRQARRLFCPFHTLQPSDLLTKHLLVKKEQSAQRLILGRSRDMPVSCQVREEFIHLPFAHFTGMAFAMKANKASDPIAIGALGAEAVML